MQAFTKRFLPGLLSFVMAFSVFAIAPAASAEDTSSSGGTTNVALASYGTTVTDSSKSGTSGTLVEKVNDGEIPSSLQAEDGRWTSANVRDSSSDSDDLEAYLEFVLPCDGVEVEDIRIQFHYLAWATAFDIQTKSNESDEYSTVYTYVNQNDGTGWNAPLYKITSSGTTVKNTGSSGTLGEISDTDTTTSVEAALTNSTLGKYIRFVFKDSNTSAAATGVLIYELQINGTPITSSTEETDPTTEPTDPETEYATVTFEGATYTVAVGSTFTVTKSLIIPENYSVAGGRFCVTYEAGYLQLNEDACTTDLNGIATFGLRSDGVNGASFAFASAQYNVDNRLTSVLDNFATFSFTVLQAGTINIVEDNTLFDYGLFNSSDKYTTVPVVTDGEVIDSSLVYQSLYTTSISLGEQNTNIIFDYSYSATGSGVKNAAAALSGTTGTVGGELIDVDRSVLAENASTNSQYSADNAAGYAFTDDSNYYHSYYGSGSSDTSFNHGNLNGNNNNDLPTTDSPIWVATYFGEATAEVGKLVLHGRNSDTTRPGANVPTTFKIYFPTQALTKDSTSDDWGTQYTGTVNGGVERDTNGYFTVSRDTSDPYDVTVLLDEPVEDAQGILIAVSAVDTYNSYYASNVVLSKFEICTPEKEGLYNDATVTYSVDSVSIEGMTFNGWYNENNDLISTERSFTVNITKAGNFTAIAEGYNGLTTDADNLAEIPGGEDSVLYANASANSYANNDNDGPAGYAFNNNDSNWWHSNYSNGGGSGSTAAPSESDPIWIQTGFGETKAIGAISYKCRTTQANSGNVIENYEVWVSDAEDFATHTVVASGTFITANYDTQPVYFNFPIECRYVRLVAYSAYNTYVTASEIKIFEYIGDASNVNLIVEGETDSLASIDAAHRLVNVITPDEAAAALVATSLEPYNNIEFDYTVEAPSEDLTSSTNADFTLPVTKSAARYTVIANVGSEQFTETKGYNQNFTEITAEGTDSAGAAFSYWQLDDGTKIADSKAFNYVATTNMTITAVYSGEDDAVGAYIPEPIYSISGSSNVVEIPVSFFNVVDANGKMLETVTDFGMVIASPSVEEADIKAYISGTADTSVTNVIKSSAYSSSKSLTNKGRYLHRFSFASAPQSNLYAYVVVDNTVYLSNVQTLNALSSVTAQ